MIIAIIGSGNVGAALARGWIKSGHTVLMGVRMPLSQKSLRLASHIGEDRFCLISQAVKQAEVVVIATPPEIIEHLVPEMGNLSNKILIDSTNSIRTKPANYPTVFHALKNLGQSQQVVKCFNSTGFENLLHPKHNGVGLDMFCAGNNKEAKTTAVWLAKDLGFENCIDFGGDDKVQLLEEFAKSWINLAILQGMGRDIAFKIVRRT